MHYMSLHKKRYSKWAQACACTLVTLVCLQVLVIPVWVHVRFENRYAHAMLRYADTLLQTEAEAPLLLKFTNAATDSLFLKLAWEDEHEFLYAGQYYDVVAEQEANGVVTYFAKADGHEVELRSALAKTTDATPEGALLRIAMLWQAVPAATVRVAMADDGMAMHGLVALRLHAVCRDVQAPPPRST